MSAIFCLLLILTYKSTTSVKTIRKAHFVLILQRVWTGTSNARAFVGTCTQARIDIIITAMTRGVTGDPFEQRV